VVHADVIRAVINNEAKIPPTKKEKEIKGLPVSDAEIVKVEPLGHDRDKNRIWSFDGMSQLAPVFVSNKKTLLVYTNLGTRSSAPAPLFPSPQTERNLNPSRRLMRNMAPRRS
jgi:hypothetical protein